MKYTFDYREIKTCADCPLKTPEQWYHLCGITDELIEPHDLVRQIHEKCPLKKVEE